MTTSTKLPNLELDADITNLRGAEYNPRKITEGDVAALQESVKTLGCVKPIIAVRKSGLIVAGHQRTRAMRGMGVFRAPVYWLERVTEWDAARFNQLHNGTDLDNGEENARFVGGFDSLGMQVADASKLEANWRCPGADVRNAIARLIKLYGPWGACVATKSGKVIHCGQYAIAAALSLDPITVYVIEDERREEYQARLSRQYGVFSYDHLKRETRIQSEAQMTRLEGKKIFRSGLWEGHVLPWLEKNRHARIVDFGCGRAEYVTRAARGGFRALGMEFFPRKDGGSCCGAKRILDVGRANSMADALFASLREDGRMDAAVCDSVLNSVDSLAAESHVMNTLNGLLRMGGRLFISGRSFGEVAMDGKRMTASTAKQGIRLSFLDEHGFSASLRDGAWFFQRYHKPEQIAELMERHGFAVDVIQDAKAGSWRRQAVKVRDVEPGALRESLAFEFNMELNDEGRTFNRHEEIISILCS